MFNSLGNQTSGPESSTQRIKEHELSEKFTLSGFGSTTKKLCSRWRSEIYFSWETFTWELLFLSWWMPASVTLLLELLNKDQWSKDSSLLPAFVLIHSCSWNVLYPKEGSHTTHSVNVQIRPIIMPELDEVGQAAAQVAQPLLPHLNWNHLPFLPQRDQKMQQRGFMYWCFLISGCLSLQPKYLSSKSLQPPFPHP